MNLILETRWWCGAITMIMLENPSGGCRIHLPVSWVSESQELLMRLWLLSPDPIRGSHAGFFFFFFFWHSLAGSDLTCPIPEPCGLSIWDFTI